MSVNVDIYGVEQCIVWAFVFSINVTLRRASAEAVSRGASLVVSRRQRVNYEAQGGGRPALLEGVALPVCLLDVDAVSKAVHQGATQPLRAKELGPLAEGQVEGN